jgi:hypothetical protein
MMSVTLGCRTCRHFNNSAPSLEAAMPGLSSFSSAYAAVRSDDGLCALHDRYVAASSVCGAHAIRRFKAPRPRPQETA